MGSMILPMVALYASCNGAKSCVPDCEPLSAPSVRIPGSDVHHIPFPYSSTEKKEVAMLADSQIRAKGRYVACEGVLRPRPPPGRGPANASTHHMEYDTISNPSCE